MKIRQAIIAGPLVLLASQAVAENWVTVYTDYLGTTYSIDKDSIRRGSDGLIYFRSDDTDDDMTSVIDCQRRVIDYFKTGTDYHSGKSFSVEDSELSSDNAELKYVCANAG